MSAWTDNSICLVTFMQFSNKKCLPLKRVTREKHKLTLFDQKSLLKFVDPNERQLKKPCAFNFLRVYGSNLITKQSWLFLQRITKIIFRLKKKYAAYVRVLIQCLPHGMCGLFYWQIALSLLTSAGPYVQIQTVFLGYRVHIGPVEKSPLGIKRGSVGLLGNLPKYL